MSNPKFNTIEVAQLYEEIKDWCHAEHPFLDPKYSPSSTASAIDFTPYVTTWLAAGREDAIEELWGFLTCEGNPSLYALKKALQARLPSWAQLSETTRHELHAIYILTTRSASLRVGLSLAATALACRQIILDPAYANELIRLARSELKEGADSDSDSTQEYDNEVKFALEKTTSPLGVAESAAEKLKAVPPMVRLVVYDYIHRGWAEGTLRFDLYYDERRYGCGGQSNQQYVDWLGFFGLPSDKASVPSVVTKDVLFEALAQRGIPCKKSATRKAILEQVREIPGLLSELISCHCPQQRELLPEWREAVNEWALRVRNIELISAALFKFMALTAINESCVKKDFFKNLSLDSIFKSAASIAHGAGIFVKENLDPGVVEFYPAQALTRVFDRDVPRGFARVGKTIVPVPDDDWPSRWAEAGALSEDEDWLPWEGDDQTGRGVALKSSDIWQQLGDLRDDSLGNPFPPFAFNSGFGVEPVDRVEAEALGLLDPGEKAKPAAIDFG
jgi:hypothetical protein